MVEVNRRDVEAVKVALKAAMRQGVAGDKTLIGAIDFLSDCYRQSGDKRYLYSALSSLQAYLELGFKYEECQEKFDLLMKDLGTVRQLQFGGQYFPTAVIPLSKSRIKMIIGAWSASKYHTMPIAEVLEDIIQKVSEKHIGRYEYHSNLKESGCRQDRVFELLISEDASYLRDVQKDQYYLFL